MNPLFSDRLPFSTHTLRAFLLCGVLLTLSTTDSHAQTLRERFKRNSASQPAAAMDAATMAAQVLQRHDANGDGLLDRLEFEQIPRIEKKDEVFLSVDADGNLGLSAVEIQEVLSARFASQAVADDSALPYSVHRDLVYGKSGHERQKLDVYVPKGEVATPKPVMVFIHGGGWTIGDKRHIQEQPAHFTSKGMVYVTINYRLGPDYIHPALVEDCAEAIAWVHDHIGEYGGDPGKIFVMGHSAGAHLAALVSTDATRLAAFGKSPAILKGSILLDGGGYDIPTLLESGNPVLRKIYLKAFTEDVEVQRNASPLLHVAPEKGIPPFLILPIESRENTNAQGQALCTALTAGGVECTVRPAPDKTHASLNRDLGKPGDLPTQWVDEFVTQQLAP